jgi:guanylate kinase
MHQIVIIRIKEIQKVGELKYYDYHTYRPSCCGKSSIYKYLLEHYSLTGIVPVTTRKPREGEVDEVDYQFVSTESWDKIFSAGAFAEYDIYSQDRRYGTILEDYADMSYDHVVCLTPNGYRSVMKNADPSIAKNIKAVYITAPLGTRMKRYIDRVGEDRFNFDDKNEISARVERDYGMFLGLEREVDLTVENDGSKTVQEIAQMIYTHPALRSV